MAALSEKHRSTIYARWSEDFGEEAAEALLSQFPTSDLDVPATKDFVRAEIAGLRTEMAQLGNHLAVRLQVTVGIAATVITAVTILTR